jgi:hypothetical protein
LLNEFRKDAIPHYLRRVISVKIDLHIGPLDYTQGLITRLGSMY